MTSLGPSRECYKPSRKSRARPAKRRARQPRPRLCLLKGCEQRFRPRRARQRYCSEPCRKAARVWSRRKAQESYRDHGGRQTEAQRAEPALPGARQEPKPAAERPVVTGQAATWDSCVSGARRRSTSARTSAGMRWSASGTRAALAKTRAG
jgi:hypothetical protein